MRAPRSSVISSNNSSSSISSHNVCTARVLSPASTPVSSAPTATTPPQSTSTLAVHWHPAQPAVCGRGVRRPSRHERRRYRRLMQTLAVLRGPTASCRRDCRVRTGAEMTTQKTTTTTTTPRGNEQCRRRCRVARRRKHADSEARPISVVGLVVPPSPTAAYAAGLAARAAPTRPASLAPTLFTETLPPTSTCRPHTAVTRSQPRQTRLS